MALGPIVQTATRPAWVVTVKQSDNSALDITGATFTGVLLEQSSAIKKSCTVGSYAITDATAGKFTYSPVAGDVDTPGLWGWETILTISSQLYIVRLYVEILPKWA